MMASAAEQVALAQITARTGATVDVDATPGILEVAYGGLTAPISLPVQRDAWSLLDLRHALPGRARGDQREMLLSAVAQDANPGHARLQSQSLADALGRSDAPLLAVGEAWQREEIAAVLRAQYFVTPSARARSRPFLFPFHAALPANYQQRGQYKMFRSDILLMLCWDGADIDPVPVRKLCELLNSNEGFTLLDQVMVDAALTFAGDDAAREIDADQLLAGPQAKKIRDALASTPAFAQPSLSRFREDFLAALDLELPRHDRVAAAIHTLALHLALYYYEVAARLGQGIAATAHAAANDAFEAPDGIAGRLRFRVGTAGDRPVRRADGCAVAWRNLDDGYLIALSPNIITANLLHRTWQAADSGATAAADPGALAAAMSNDDDLRVVVDAASASLAVLYGSRCAAQDPPALVALAHLEPGPHALRKVILDDRRKTLKYTSRDVVNQLVRRPFGGSLIRTRGAVNFFELDEEFLFLLVKFIVTRSGQREVQFSDFLAQLAPYGFVAQDEDEADALAGALERLGMLTRYSDAGEATYVRNAF